MHANWVNLQKKAPTRNRKALWLAFAAYQARLRTLPLIETTGSDKKTRLVLLEAASLNEKENYENGFHSVYSTLTFVPFPVFNYGLHFTSMPVVVSPFTLLIESVIS